MRSSRPNFFPFVERLENRWCPAVSLKASGGELRITGDNLDNTVEIVAQPNGDLVVTTESGVGTFSKIKELEINLKGGNDTLTIDLSDKPRLRGELEAKLGAGDDTVALASMWPARDRHGHFALRRVYGFDYSDTGHERRHGTVTLLGNEVLAVDVDVGVPEGATRH